MTLTVVFRPQAGDEADAARRWYDEQKPGLGNRFVDAVDAMVGSIAANPTAFPRVLADMRRAVLREFPFAIYFRVQGDAAIVLAVMHGRRHPDHWQRRR